MSRKNFKPQTCFVVMPFDKKFDPVYESIVEAVTGPGLYFASCESAAKRGGGGYIMEDVLRSIEQSEVIVADVTGNNENVLYELGYAHKAKSFRNVIIITQTMERAPFDIRGYRLIDYDMSDLERLKQELVASIREVTPSTFRFVVADGETYPFHDAQVGLDGRHYRFDLGPVGIANKGAQFGMTVRRHVPGKTDEFYPMEKCPSLYEGDDIVVPHLGWKLVLDAVSDGKAHFCLCEPERNVGRRKRQARG
jgi:hypothetical protein